MKLYEAIAAENWKRGSDGCVINHMLKAGLVSPLTGSVSETAEYGRLREAVSLLFPDRARKAGSYTCVFEFNDHPDTTVDDVIRVCKLADV